MKNIYYKKNTRRGFTVIETLISVFIFTVVLASYMSLVSSSIASSKENSLSVIARNLSVEGIELVENLRDTNFLDSESDPQRKKNWLLGIRSGAHCDIEDGCIADSDRLIKFGGKISSGEETPSPFLPCTLNADPRIQENSTCPFLKLDPVLGYNYERGEETPFKRILLTHRTKAINEDPNYTIS